jgi:hypothetical protein
MHHAMNHVRFMISPELDVVQDRCMAALNHAGFRAEALDPTWFGAKSEFSPSQKAL